MGRLYSVEKDTLHAMNFFVIAEKINFFVISIFYYRYLDDDVVPSVIKKKFP